MTAKEKAKELVNNHYNNGKHLSLVYPKKHALITVDEIVKECKQVNSRVDFDTYWQEVKAEIEKL